MNRNDQIRHVVIAGGGTAGWMAAAALSRLTGNGITKVTLVESDEIGIVGVGEATIPPIKTFNAMLGIDENDFLSQTEGTFKLGIEFDGWLRPSHSYLHPFGAYGHDINGIRFHQIWLKQCQSGFAVPFGAFNLCTIAAKLNRFARPSRDEGGAMPPLDYAFHFDAALYARYLSRYAQRFGVSRIEGKIKHVELREDGFISALQLENDLRISGDLFIDCTGFRGVLIEQALKTGYEDWTHWLPCDRAAAVPSGRIDPLLPYTRSTAQAAGWQWRIPLQHRTGNGLVFCSGYISDDEAVATLIRNLDGPQLGEPRVIPFRTGRRKLAWNKNCVALGLAAGFMEPLESTSIHLVQAGISKLLALFPSCNFSALERDEYNRLTALQWEQVRDFLIAHYKLNRREEPFWRACSDMGIPETLRRKLGLFAGSGRFFRYEDELFVEPSWTAVLLGQGLIPENYDPLVDTMNDSELQRIMMNMMSAVRHAAENMPAHADFIRRNCASTRIKEI
ncbi:MAG: tryptophan halogenase family protein [Steroidobacter sp.]